MDYPSDYTNLNRWTRWYSRLKPGTHTRPMGAKRTYKLAADWLAPCTTIEDRGCGPGGARPYFAGKRYIGLDGTNNPFVDRQVDLAVHVSNPPADGVLLRHVLEHDYRWRSVLSCALASARYRAVVISYVPMEPVDRRLTVTWSEIPVLALSRPDFLATLSGSGMSLVKTEIVAGKSLEFGREEVFYLER